MKFTKRKKKRSTRYSRKYREEMGEMMWQEIGKAAIHGGDIDAIVTATNISMSPVVRRTERR